MLLSVRIECVFRICTGCPPVSRHSGHPRALEHTVVTIMFLPIFYDVHDIGGQMAGTGQRGYACCSDHAQSSTFVKLTGCGAMQSGYPYEMFAGSPALWMCQYRVDCTTYFKQNTQFLGCFFSSDGPASYVMVNGMSAPYFPLPDYIGGLWIVCLGLVIVFGSMASKRYLALWLSDHPNAWVVVHWRRADAACRRCCLKMRCKCCDRLCGKGTCTCCEPPVAAGAGDAAAKAGADGSSGAAAGVVAGAGSGRWGWCCLRDVSG